MAAVGALRRLAASLLALGRIRLELFSLEVQEEKRRVASLLFWAVLAALAVGFAVVFAVLWVTVLLWEQHRALVLGASALGFVLLAAFGVARLRGLASARSTLFDASLGELRRDEARLRAPSDPAAGAPDGR